MMAELGTLGSECTASPAGLSMRSEGGNIGGVLAGIKKYIDNRPLSICLDAEVRDHGLI